MRADASGRWCGGAGLEENINEGLIKPIGSDWLATDSISLPFCESELANVGFSNQEAEASGLDPLTS
ncbi:hypothetical protein EXN66_Car004361 [Channa argus]|uniref:Uncharacterized protein n=1 Tax=Channa argus TaxID=215402 RepID=A0A6G1PEQ2_CHAAH|nr:hypothetical protein EXN66_Car004361 [Channa argus]